MSIVIFTWRKYSNLTCIRIDDGGGRGVCGNRTHILYVGAEPRANSWTVLPPFLKEFLDQGLGLVDGWEGLLTNRTRHRRRIKTEEKKTVVTSVWGKEMIQFLAALTVLPGTILNNGMNCTRMI